MVELVEEPRCNRNSRDAGTLGQRSHVGCAGRFPEDYLVATVIDSQAPTPPETEAQRPNLMGAQARRVPLKLPLLINVRFTS